MRTDVDLFASLIRSMVELGPGDPCRYCGCVMTVHEIMCPWLQIGVILDQGNAMTEELMNPNASRQSA